MDGKPTSPLVRRNIDVDLKFGYVAPKRNPYCNKWTIYTTL